MKRNLRISLLIITLSFAFGNSMQAVGVGVKPKEINLQAKVGKEIATEFLVMNVSDEPAMYQVYLDGLEKEIALEPADFQLEPDGNQIVKVIIKSKMPGRFNTNISVVARPLGAGGFAAASGVKIPITINVDGFSALWLIFVVVICLISGFGVLLIKVNKSKAVVNKSK